MKALAWKLAATAAILTVAFVPTASAKSSPKVALSSIPLRASSLGPAARGLTLADDSGVLSEVAESEHAFFGAAGPGALKGRLTGYALHYGNEASGLPGLDSVWTSVDTYTNAKDAKKALAFWKRDDRLFTQFDHGGLSVANTRVKVPAVGSARFANLTSYSASNIAPVSSFDEWFADGRSLLDVRVAAGTAIQAETLAPGLAKKLDARLRLALKGRLHAHPATILPRPKAGPPPGGPDLSAMALAPTDLPGAATLLRGAYASEPWPPPDYLDLSHYEVVIDPAGPFDSINQDIEWFPTANEASFFADRWFATDARTSGVKRLDLSTVGDGARGVYENFSTNGEAVFTFSTGQLVEVVQILTKSAVPVSDVTSVAHTAASKIDAALGS